MAIFRPTQESNVCKLNFDDKFIYELPLHEDTTKAIAKVAEKQMQALKQIKDNDDDGFDKAYNLALDAIDGILGEGAGADIMSLYSKPSLFDIAAVISFITKEYKVAYNARLNAYKAQGAVPPTNAPNNKRGRR